MREIIMFCATVYAWTSQGYPQFIHMADELHIGEGFG